MSVILGLIRMIFQLTLPTISLTIDLETQKFTAINAVKKRKLDCTRSKFDVRWYVAQILKIKSSTNHSLTNRIYISSSSSCHAISTDIIATPPYRLLLSADPQGHIPYRHRAAVCRFELDVLRFLVHVKGSIGVHHLWTRPYFSCSVPGVWLV